MSIFSNVQPLPPIEVFELNAACTRDQDPKKVNLGIGAFRTEEGKPWVLPVVREAEKQIANDDSLNHEYLPVIGYDVFTDAATQLVLGNDSKALKEGRVLGVQCLSGTGSLRVALEFLSSIMKFSICYVSEPTWENHHLMCKNTGFKECRIYRYWDANKKGLDFQGMLDDLRKAPENAVVILHGAAHNPTGMDPTQEEWQQIAQVVRERKLFTLFDIAYQGFASGDLDRDAYPVRLFDSLGMESFTAQSFAKNFGLYNERIGNLVVVVNDKNVINAMRSQIAIIIRATWSNPPAHGARVVAKVLTDNKLREQWKQNVKTMADRMLEMRGLLKGKLDQTASQQDWSHLTRQIGMFGYTGLTEPQTLYLKEKYHIYMLKSGRINVCGITKANVDYVAQAFGDAIANVK